jgi:hypothetical protein
MIDGEAIEMTVTGHVNVKRVLFEFQTMFWKVLDPYCSGPLSATPIAACLVRTSLGDLVFDSR